MGFEPESISTTVKGEVGCSELGLTALLIKISNELVPAMEVTPSTVSVLPTKF